MKRQRFYCFLYFVQNTDIHLSGNRWNSTIDEKLEVNYLYNGQLRASCRAWTVIWSSSSLSSTSRSTDIFFRKNWDHYQTQSRLEVTSMHAGNRCWQSLTSRPRETVNQHAKIFSDEMYKEDPTQDIPDWLQPVTVNLEDLEKCARRFLWKSEHRFGRWRFKSGDTKNGSTVLMLTSANTERDLFHEQKRLVTWQQWSTKSSTKDVNLGTITSSLPWYKVSPFSGYYPCENRTSQETEKNFYGSFQRSHISSIRDMKL